MKTFSPWSSPAIVILAAAIVFPRPICAAAQEKSGRVELEERLGATIPLDDISFNDEDGKRTTLRPFFDKPVLLLLVYFRCPGICTPLLQDLAKAVDECDLRPGKDYRLVTISFDPSEDAEMAKLKRENMLAYMKKPVSPQDWRFLTGDEANIHKITEAVGFHYMRDKNGVDFVHPTTLIFVTPEGTIARYLEGADFSPADLKMAILDASAGHVRGFMKRVQQLCYAYDPKAGAYVLKFDRVILGITALFVLAFVAYLAIGKARDQPKSKADAAQEPPEKGLQ